MYTIHDTSDFFPDNRPAVLPDDAAPPDYWALCDRVRTLSSGGRSHGRLADVLLAGNTAIGADDTAIDRLKAIDDGTVFVVSGQQAGLFGGPLYTLYKALHAVRLAARLEGDTGVTVVPVFWVASDDHDVEEVSGLGLRTRDGSATRVSYEPASRIDGMPVGDMVLDDAVSAALETLEKHLPPGDRGTAYMALVRDAWEPGRRWTEAFARQMSRLLAGHGLVMLDPRWPGIKELFLPVMRAELDAPLASSRIINEQADAFDTPQERRHALRRPDGTTNLFMETDGVRHPVHVEDDIFTAGPERMSGGDMAALLARESHRFSPGAALRPVCQDAMMPVAALIGGPGERRYLRQVRALYSLFGVDGSLVWPRASFTFIDRRTTRAAGKEGIDLPRLFEPPDHLLAEMAASGFPDDIDKEITGLAGLIGERFRKLGDMVGTLDTTLGPYVASETGRALHILDGIRDKAVRAHKASSDLSSSRITSMTSFLQPDGGPQERWFGADSIFPALGFEGLAKFAADTSPGEERHRIVVM